MVDFSQIRNFQLKVIFLSHFTLTTLACFGFWTGSSYLFYNGILVLTLLLLILNPEHEYEEHMIMAIVINGLSLFFDVLLLLMSYPDTYRVREGFAVAFVVLHLFFRIFSIITLNKLLQQRTGTPGPISNIFARNSRQRSYDDIDRTATTAPTSHQRAATIKVREAPSQSENT